MRIAELMGGRNDDVQRVALHLKAATDVAHGLQPAMQAIQGTQHDLRIAITNVRFDAILHQRQILVYVLIEKEV